MTNLVDKKKLWILESDHKIEKIYKEILLPIYDIQFFKTIQDFTSAIETMPKPHLIITTLQLTDGNFIDLIRNKFSTIVGTPYMVISEDISIESLKFCLREGASDYLTKPFNINEVLVKIARLIHQYIDPKLEKLKKLDEHFRRTVLTYTEDSILKILVNDLNCFITRKKMITLIWGDRNDFQPKTLDVHLYNLRRKLEPLGIQIYSDGARHLKLL